MTDTKQAEQVKLLLHSIDYNSRVLGCDPQTAFKACMTYAIDLAWTNTDKEGFVRMAQEGWDLRVEEIEKRKPKDEP